jgi:hypothetical protein
MSEQIPDLFSPSVSKKLQELSEQLQETFRQIDAAAPAIESAIAKLDAEVTRAILEDGDRSPLRRRTAYHITILAQHGWFPSGWETPLDLINYAAQCLGTNMHTSAEAALVQHFDFSAPKTCETLCNKHPDRKSILIDALCASRI